MLQPPNSKYRKMQKGRSRGMAKNPKVCFGEYGLKAHGYCRLTARQIEAARRAIARSVKRGGKVWIRVFPDKPITKKPLEVRQGKGKGNVEYYIFPVKPGTVIFEIAGVDLNLVKKAFALASAKLPVKVSMISKIDEGEIAND